MIIDETRPVYLDIIAFLRENAHTEYTKQELATMFYPGQKVYVISSAINYMMRQGFIDIRFGKFYYVRDDTQDMRILKPYQQNFIGITSRLVLLAADSCDTVQQFSIFCQKKKWEMRNIPKNLSQQNIDQAIRRLMKKNYLDVVYSKTRIIKVKRLVRISEEGYPL